MADGAWDEALREHAVRARDLLLRRLSVEGVAPVGHRYV